MTSIVTGCIVLKKITSLPTQNRKCANVLRGSEVIHYMNINGIVALVPLCDWYLYKAISVSKTDQIL